MIRLGPTVRPTCTAVGAPNCEAGKRSWTLPPGRRGRGLQSSLCRALPPGRGAGGFKVLNTHTFLDFASGHRGPCDQNHTSATRICPPPSACHTDLAPPGGIPHGALADIPRLPRGLDTPLPISHACHTDSRPPGGWVLQNVKLSHFPGLCLPAERAATQTETLQILKSFGRNSLIFEEFRFGLRPFLPGGKVQESATVSHFGAPTPLGVSNPCGRRGISARGCPIRVAGVGYRPGPRGVSPRGAPNPCGRRKGGGKSVWLTCDFGHMGPCARKQSPGTCECLAL